MKSLLYSLRVLIAAGSLGGFLGGWALFAHSGKPVASAPEPPAQVAPSQSQDLSPLSLPQLQPVQPLQPLPSFSSGPRMRLRTGGS